MVLNNSWNGQPWLKDCLKVIHFYLLTYSLTHSHKWEAQACGCYIFHYCIRIRTFCTCNSYEKYSGYRGADMLHIASSL